MLIADQLKSKFEELNEDQRKIVSHKKGPLRVIAGPGSGKTHSLTLLAMNLLLCGDAEPSQIILCTYTEKAARELDDRITALASEVGYRGDMSSLQVGTIHSLCRKLVNKYLHHTLFGHDYELLDQFTQALLIFRNLSTLCSDNAQRLFLQSWETPWSVAKKLQFYFNTITEELIIDNIKEALPDLNACKSHKDRLVYHVSSSYDEYRRLLVNMNSMDFAYIQKNAYTLLCDPQFTQQITQDIRYVLVDEYQDTNYIQERILLLLASGCDPKNFIVIGDEDQALYRFRGATVRNILKFSKDFPDGENIPLTINYRSHQEIITTYNEWIETFDWSNPGGSPLRIDKQQIVANPADKQKNTDYPATVTLEGANLEEEADKFAELVESLKQQGKIKDYSEVALLLRSVRNMVDPYITALNKKGILAYYPRAQRLFYNREIMLIIGCFMRILHYFEEQDNSQSEETNFTTHLTKCLQLLGDNYVELEEELQVIEQEVQMVEEQGKEPKAFFLADYFYRLIFLEPFAHFLQDENQKANLVLFSGLLRTFQKYYPHSFVTLNTLAAIRTDFFHAFLAFLFDDGLNEDEHQYRPLLKGHVQIMTIHQAKGLEFPVVVVGQLNSSPSKPKPERRDLQPYYNYSDFDPEKLIAGCDHRRLYYVAFSRAKSLLVLTISKNQPHKSFTTLWQNIRALEYLSESFLALPVLSTWEEGRDEEKPPKPRYGYTTHIQTYQTCPRRYHIFYEHRFIPSRRIDTFFGQLVHQTIEFLHRLAIDGETELFDEEKLQKLFERTYTLLRRTSKRSLTPAEQEQAFNHVRNYYQHNQHRMRDTYATEHAVRLAYDNYVLNGKVDLLLCGDQGLEIFDFKTGIRAVEDSSRFKLYQQQLYFYAYALYQKQQVYPRSLSLYWTSEESEEKALMEVEFSQDDIEQVKISIDETITQIQRRDFTVKAIPEKWVCETCDVRFLCKREGLIS